MISELIDAHYADISRVLGECCIVSDCLCSAHPPYGRYVAIQLGEDMCPWAGKCHPAWTQHCIWLLKPFSSAQHSCANQSRSNLTSVSDLRLLVMPGAGSVAVFTVSSSFSSLWHPLPTVTLCDGKLLVLICFFFTALKKHQRRFVVLRCHLVGIAMRFPTLCFFLTSRFSERRQWSLERNCYLLSTLPLGYHGHCLILRGKTTYFW